MSSKHTMATPIGDLQLFARGDALVWIQLPESDSPPPDGVERELSSDPASVELAVLARAAAQLAEYFRGERTEFDLSLALDGTAFQRTVWEQLTTIPYAATWSYGQLARAIGKPQASRAVGAANGRNPIAIVVPCHRVIGTNGSLTGYGGGMAAKRWLLAHERDHARPGAAPRGATLPLFPPER
jgi:methylated-DNA-[protein]-cysteine S-methyltransferase